MPDVVVPKVIPMDAVATAAPVGKSVPAAPPPMYMLPVEVATATSQDAFVFRQTEFPITIGPFPPAELLQRTRSAPFVWSVLEARTSIPPRDLALITPVELVVVMFAFTVSRLVAPSVVRVTGPTAEIAAVIVIVETLEVTETEPEVEVKVAPEFVIAPVPESVMLPVALIAPVGSTDDPPAMRTVPAEAVSEPAPE